MTWKTIKFGDLFEQYRIQHIVQDNRDYGQITISKNGYIKFRTTKNGKTIGRKRQFIIDLKTYPNTLLFTRQGVAEGAIAFAQNEVNGCIVTENMPMFSLKNGIDRKFVELLLKSEQYISAVKKLIPTGSAQKSIHERDLMQIALTVPSEEEQKKLSYIIHNRLNSIDILNSEILIQQTLLKKLRQSILQEAIEGKLTASWREENPDVEPASVLLEKIKKEKEQLVKDKKIKKQKPLPPISEDEIPFDIPDGWEWCRLGSILDSLIGGNSYLSSLFKEDGVNQVLRLGNIRPYKLRLNAKPVYITEELATETLNVELKINDILISMTGTRGKRDYCYTVLLQENDFKDRRLFLNQRVGCFRFNNNILPKFYDYVLKNDLLLDNIYKTATGSANQANIGSTALSLWSLPLPPLQEQKEIVQKIESLFKICDELETQINSSKVNSEILMQAVLKEAFEG